jgi:hypothetical protein
MAKSAKKSSVTFINLNRDDNELLSGPEWSGTPDAETGVFRIGDQYIIRLLDFRRDPRSAGPHVSCRCTAPELNCGPIACNWTYFP